MNKFLLGLCVVLLATSFRAQTFVPASVVTLKGDTIKGEGQINSKKPIQKYDKVILKDANGILKNYKADKVTSYSLGTDHFISLNEDGDPRFYRVLAKGAVNLYELGFEVLNGSPGEVDLVYYFSYPENKRLVEVKKKKFKKQLADWLKENPEIAATYTDEEFDATKAAAIINDFNTWKSTH